MQSRHKKSWQSVKSMVVLFTLLAAVTVLLPAAGVADDDKTYRWRVQHPWPSGSMYDNQTKIFADRVKQLSGGKLEITMFGVGTLAGTFESLDAISKSVYEAHISIPAYWAGKMPVGTFLLGVFGGIEDPADWNAWYYRFDGLEIAREAYAKFNVHYLSPVMTPGNAPMFLRKEKPVRSMADFKGLKLRASTGLQSEIVKAIGAAPVLMPVQDVYTSLETGVIDGVTAFTIVGWKNLGIQEIAKWAIEPGFVLRHSALEFCVGTKAWGKLPEHLQAVLLCAVREFSTDFYSYGIIEDAKAYQAMKAAGVETLVLPEADMKQIYAMAVKLADAYAEKDPLAKKAWESQKAYLTLTGKMK